MPKTTIYHSMLNKSQKEIVKKSSYQDLVTKYPEIFYLLKKHILLKKYGFDSPPKIPLKFWTREQIFKYASFCANENQFRTLFFDAYVIAKRNNFLKELWQPKQKKVAPIIEVPVVLIAEVPKDSLGEQLVRKTFEYHFKVAFPKIKPKWLVNPKTKARMELDGYSKKMKIAFEVNGVHHYQLRFTKHTDVRFKDKLKKTLCKRKGIQLYSIKFLALPQLINLLHKEFNIPLEWLTKTLLRLNQKESKINCKIQDTAILKKLSRK